MWRFRLLKTADETFNKWHGHDIALGDMVRAIRIFRPDILIARFSGTPRDGHGHHQASALLTVEAFRAAGDPNKFPEQIKEGLLPWQAKKLYVGNPPGMFQRNVAEQDYSVKLNIDTSAVQYAGMSCTVRAGRGWPPDFARDRRHPRATRPALHYYRLKTFSHLPKSDAAHEAEFTDGIDRHRRTGRAATEEAKVPS